MDVTEQLSHPYKLNEDKTELIVITPTRQSHKVMIHQRQQVHSGIFNKSQECWCVYIILGSFSGQSRFLK